MKKKLLFIILSFVVIVSMLYINVSAITISESVNYLETFSPNYIIIHSHDEIVISNTNEWSGGATTTTSIEGGAYSLDIDSYDDLIMYSLDDSFDSFELSFEEFHTDSNTQGPWLSQYFDIECIGNDQLVIDVFVSYEVWYYLGDGSLMVTEHIDYIESPNNKVQISVREYAEKEYDRNGWIGYFDIVVNCSEPIDTFTISNYAAENYGVDLGPKIPEDLEITRIENVVNPNILGWLTTSIDGFMKTEIFGDLTIGGIIAFVLAIPMVTWFLKLVAGG